MTVPPEIVEEAAEIVECINQCARFAMDSRDFRDREANQEVVRLATRRLSEIVVAYPAIRITALRDFDADFKMICQATEDLKRETLRRR